MGYLTTTCGHRVYYEDHRSATSNHGTMLLVHGWGMSTRCWDPILPALVGAGLRVITFDHRGCGNSDLDFPDMGIEAIAGDLVALVGELGLERVVINGWSLGGAVAVAAASQLGDRCAALVLTGGATPIYTQKEDFPHGGTVEDVAGTVAAYATNRIDFLEGLSHVVCVKDVGVHVTEWLKELFFQTSPMAGATLAELAHLDQRDQLLSLDMPVLSLFGSEDGFVAPPICRWVGEHHPRALSVEFPGVGHAPFLEERDAYLDSLLGFVAEHGGKSE